MRELGVNQVFLWSGYKNKNTSFKYQAFYIRFLPQPVIWMTSLSVSVMLSGVENLDPEFYDSSFK